MAYALSGRIDIDLANEPLGTGSDGEPVFLRDIGPSRTEINSAVRSALKSEMFTREYDSVFAGDSRWQDLPVLQGPEGSARSLMASYQRVIEILGPLGLTVERLAVDDRSQLEAVLDTGMTLVLGGDAFRERMQRFVAVYQSELAPRLAEVERVDLRYESGVAVKFNEPPAVAETDNESRT